MCGIVGIFDTRGQRPPKVELLRRMNQVQLHRGPDEGDEHVEPGIGLGHRRLSIIDLSSGQQPLWNEDHTVVVIFNGEIYNFGELRPELEAAGHRFRTHSDTEVIVHAWEEWGEACVQRFNGMFAFAIWDRNRQTLFLARDRLGKKPLYYTVTPDGELLFASELKSILADPRVSRDLDLQAVEDYFAYGYVPEPRSILRAVQKLRPAHTLCWVRGEAVPKPREYWDLEFAPNGAESVAEAGHELISRLREAVRLRLISEVPLGAFLSGGVDSSAVVAMMAGLSEQPVNTCSISFGDPSFDESEHAQAVASRYRANHRSQRVESQDFDLIDTLAKTYDEPFADSSAIPTYRVCQLARRNVTVALSGDGGDEVFAGYRRYRWHMYEENVRSILPDPVRRPLFGALGRIYPKIDWAPKFLRAKSTLEAIGRSSLEGFFHSVSILPDRLRWPMYSERTRRELNGYHAISVLEEHARRGPEHPLSLVQYLDIKTYLPGDILVKVDRASMAHSLEVRVPMLDYRFVEWAASLPPALKLRAGEGKYVLKRSLEPYLPRDVMYRPKMGFAVPIASWFRGPLRERVRSAVLGEHLRSTGLFEHARLEQLVDQHQRGIRDHSAALWSLLMFESAHRRVVGE